MPTFKLSPSGLEALQQTTFEAEGIRERAGLQQVLRDSPEVMEEGLFILDEEFGNWEDSKRRIDLLGLDSAGKLVVIEFKRTQDGGHMELQAIRYAAMVANMTLDQAIEAHATYLRSRNSQEDARERVLVKLRTAGLDEPLIDSKRPRILLVSADFSKELTTSVLWLIDVGIDIRCVRVRPYRLADSVLVDVEQILPLPEATDYLVKVRQRVAEEDEAAASRSRRESTLTTLMRAGMISSDMGIEFDERRLTAAFTPSDRRIFHAHFAGDLTVRASVIWEFDGQSYSLSGLTEKLRDAQAVPLPRGAFNGFQYWKPNGATETLWELAEAAGRN